MNLFTLAAKLTIDTAEFNAQIAKADNRGQAFAEGLGNAFSKLAKTAVISLAAVGTAATALIVKLGKTGFEYNLQMEQYTTNFKVLLGSAEAAAAKVEELKRMAAKTPFVMSDLADATQTLLSFQVSANETTDILKILGDISLGDKQKLSGLALVFGQVASAGKLAGQDLMQFINQGFNPLNYIAQRTGETMEQLRKRMSDGKVTVQEVKQAMIDATSEGGMFYNGMEEGSKTVAGQWSTLEGNWADFLGKVMEPVNLAAGESIIPALIRGLQTISDALFGVQEDAEQTKKVLFTDTTGAEINPSSNLATWFSDLLQVWSDGKPEDDKIVKDFVDGFKANTASIVDVLQARVDDVTGAYTDEEKEEMQRQIDRLHELDTEVEALLQKRKNGLLTQEDTSRLQQTLAEINAIQTSISVATASDVDLTSWFASLKQAFEGTEKDDSAAVASFAKTFNQNTDILKSALQERMDDMTLSDEDKEKYKAASAQIEAWQHEINDIFSSAGDNLTDSDITRIGELTSNITELANSLGMGNAQTALSPWERFISKISGMAVDGIDSLATLIADFLSDPQNIENALNTLEEGFDAAVRAAKTLADVLETIFAPFVWIREAINDINSRTTEDRETMNESLDYVAERLATRGENYTLKDVTPPDVYTSTANQWSGWYHPEDSASGSGNTLEWVTPPNVFGGAGGGGSPLSGEEISAIPSSVEDILTEAKGIADTTKNHATSEDIAALGESIMNQPLQVDVYLDGVSFANNIAGPTRTAQKKLNRKIAIGRGK